MKLNPGYTPGCTTYKLDNNVNKKKDFSSGNSGNFTKPIAKASIKKTEGPAPNEYDVANASKHRFKTNNVAANAAFKSHTKRDFLEGVINKYNPAPGAYDVNDDIAHDSSKIPFSSFKSTSQRQTFMSAENVPGPADYRPMEPINENINRLLFP